MVIGSNMFSFVVLSHLSVRSLIVAVSIKHRAVNLMKSIYIIDPRNEPYAFLEANCFSMNLFVIHSLRLIFFYFGEIVNNKDLYNLMKHNFYLFIHLLPFKLLPLMSSSCIKELLLCCIAKFFPIFLSVRPSV